MVVAHQIVQGEAVMGSEEIDRRLRANVERVPVHDGFAALLLDSQAETSLGDARDAAGDGTAGRQRIWIDCVDQRRRHARQHGEKGFADATQASGSQEAWRSQTGM